MNLTNNYRYTLTSRRGVLQFAPIGEGDFTLSWSQQTQGKRYYKKEFPGTLVIKGPAFDALYLIEKSIYRCEYVDILMERRCTAGRREVWQTWFTGRMLLNDGNFDEDREQLTIKLAEVQDYSCYDDNKSVDVNILNSVGVRYSIGTTDPNIVVDKIEKTDAIVNNQAGRCVFYAWDEPYTAASVGYVVYYNQAHSDYLPGMTTPYICNIITRYARYRITVACGAPSPGDDWILLTDTCPGGERQYVKPASLYDCQTTDDTPDLGSYINTTYSCLIAGDDGTISSIDNGMKLADVLNVFVGSYCYPMLVKSEFLQINPDVVTTINYVTGLRSKTDNIFIFQKSDVKRPNVSGNATIATTTFEQVLTNLINLYNMAWRMYFDEGVGMNVLRIEHVKYWDTDVVSLDLTQARYNEFTNKLRRYGYANDEIPGSETFSFMEASQGDFTGYPIVYDKGCVSKSSSDNVVNHALTNVTTDVQLCITNPDPDSAAVSDDGFVWVACRSDGDGHYYIITESAVYGQQNLNNSMAWCQLHRDYWMYERPVKQGALNGLETTFLTVKPTKKGDKLTVPFCCDDDFNPDLKVKTFFGLGTVAEATFNFVSNTIELNLLYNADEDLTTNTPPVAGNISTSVYQPLFLDLDVLAVCSDPDPGDEITGVIILIPPTHGTATVLANKKIRYIPNPGYVGNDNIVYNVIDGWSEPSNNGLIAIVVRATNTGPTAGDVSFSALENTELDQAAPGAFTNASDDVGYTLQSADTMSVHGGTVAVNSDGSFTYTPAPGYLGPDSFNYTIIDGEGLTDTGTVTINVADPNVPIANPDNYGARKNTAKTFPAPGVMANDSTLVGSLTVTAETKATDQGGIVTLYADGSFDYTPPLAYTGNDTFTYTLDNGTDTATGHVTIHVFPDIWVKLVTVTADQVTILSACEPDHDNGGFSQDATQKLYFYSDAGGTTPFDVTGLYFVIDVVEAGQTQTGAGAGPSTPTDVTYKVTGTGTETDYVRINPVHKELFDCVPQRVRYEDYAYSIGVNPDYEII